MTTTKDLISVARALTANLGEPAVMTQEQASMLIESIEQNLELSAVAGVEVIQVEGLMPAGSTVLQTEVQFVDDVPKDGDFEKMARERMSMGVVLRWDEMLMMGNRGTGDLFDGLLTLASANTIEDPGKMTTEALAKVAGPTGVILISLNDYEELLEVYSKTKHPSVPYPYVPMSMAIVLEPKNVKLWVSTRIEVSVDKIDMGGQEAAKVVLKMLVKLALNEPFSLVKFHG